MKRRFLAVLAAVVLLLAGCGEVSGPVVDKDFKPAHITFDQVARYTQQCYPRTSTVNGVTTSTMSCSQVFSHYDQVPRHVPDKWLLQVHDTESDKKKWVQVTQNKYESTAVGDHFSNKKEDQKGDDSF